MSLVEQVNKKFRSLYGEDPAGIARAPGRVNLIGEHTDYNDGFVLPMAINRSSIIAFRPRADEWVKIHSLDFQDEAEFDLAHLEKGEMHWSEYIKGVAYIHEECHERLKGWEGVMAGDVPIGSGLSSSAALEVAASRVFATVSGLRWDAVDMALLSQQAENKWVGVNCGIMDQMISATGQAGHAVLIDCRSLELKPVPLPPGVTVVILDTSTRRELADSAYNERREQCEAVSKSFGVQALRDVSLQDLEARRGALDDSAYKRARHVISENERTLKAAEVMAQGDADALGQLMDASHVSLRDDFEVSNEALNVIVDLSRTRAGCLGARMTGAGFGGCAVALVEEAATESFVESVTPMYREATGLDPQVYVTPATAGAEILG